MRYSSLFHLTGVLLSFSLPATFAADSRYCMNKNVIAAKDFTLQESADNPHLAALAKHFESTGKNVSVSTVLNSANRDLNQGHPSVGTGSPNEAWA
jgi:hypothetical protein